MSQFLARRATYGPLGSTNLSTTMPITDPDPTMQIVWSNDFLEDVSEGGFVTMTTGDLGKLDPAYPGGAVYAEGGTSAGGPWKAKELMSGTSVEPDTRYDAVSTTSVAASALRIRSQRLSDGTLRASALKPIFGNGVDFSVKTKITWRSWSNGDVNMSYVFDFIGSDADWSAGGGELGFPENQVAASDAHIFYRYKIVRDAQHPYVPDSLSTGVDPRQPHIYEATWDPGVSLTCKIDGITKLTDTDPDRVWSTPKRWVLQTGGTSTTTGAEGNVYVDWVVVSQPA